MPKAAVYGIIFSPDAKQVLLVKRRDLPVWVLPGGGLDPEETPEKGVKREVEEEIGALVDIVRPIAHYLPVNRLTQKAYFFECSITKGAPKATKESKEVAFFPLDRLPKNLPPPFTYWIADAQKKIPFFIQDTIGVTYYTLLTTLLSHPLLVLRYFLTKIGIRWNDFSS